jgi:glycosyltransferase involved in cell wall biosynthesis
MRPRVSIVIPARNDAAALARTLDDLGGLEDIAASETIVAASGNPEGTEQAVRDARWSEPPSDTTDRRPTETG